MSVDVYLLILLNIKAMLLFLMGMLLNSRLYSSSSLSSAPSFFVNFAALTFLLASWVVLCKSLNQAHPGQAIALPPEVQPVTDVINQLAELRHLGSQSDARSELLNEEGNPEEALIC